MPRQAVRAACAVRQARLTRAHLTHTHFPVCSAPIHRNFSGFALKGTIPEAVGTAFAFLSSIDLAANQLEGSFPASLKNIVASRLTVVLADIVDSDGSLTAAGSRLSYGTAVSGILGTSYLDITSGSSVTNTSDDGTAGSNSRSATAASASSSSPAVPTTASDQSAWLRLRHRLADANSTVGVVAANNRSFWTVTVLCQTTDSSDSCSTAQQWDVARALDSAAAALGYGLRVSRLVATTASQPLLAVSAFEVARSVTAAGNAAIVDCLPSDNQDDCRSLLSILASFGGALWPADGSTSLCTWRGIVCNGIGRVSELVLQNHTPALAGTIPPEVGDLASLWRVDFSNNAGLVGTLPQTLRLRAAAGQLKEWRFGNCSLHDCGLLDDPGDCAPMLRVRAAWGLWSRVGGESLCTWGGALCSPSGRLVGLNLSGFNLTAGVPEALGNLPALASLDLSDNAGLDGALPRSLRRLAAQGTLTVWEFGRTRIRDCGLRDDLAQCAALMVVNETWRGLWAAHGGSSYCSWPYVACSSPAATGGGNASAGGAFPLVRQIVMRGEPSAANASIPAALGNLTSLEVLSLEVSNLTGTLPPQLAQLTMLSRLSLEGNALKGRIAPLRALLHNRSSAAGGGAAALQTSVAGNLIEDCGAGDDPAAGECDVLLSLAAEWGLFARGMPWDGRGGSPFCGGKAQSAAAAAADPPWSGVTCGPTGAVTRLDFSARRANALRAAALRVFGPWPSPSLVVLTHH